MALPINSTTQSKTDSDVFSRRRSAEPELAVRPSMAYKYRVTVLEELARHGIIPVDDTPPDLIHDYINGLYLIEIRALKRMLQAGSIPLAEYAKHVEKLRDRYPLLSLPLRYWLEPG